MSLPIFSLPTSGTDPRATTKQVLEDNVNAVISALYGEFAAGLSGLAPKGNWDASSGAFPSGTAVGDYYIVSVAGTVDGKGFEVGDWLVSIADNASISAFAANWFRGDYSQINLRQFANTGTMAGSMTLVPDAFYTVESGFNGETETFQYDADSTLTADGAIVVNATGMGVGRLITSRVRFSSQSELKAMVATGRAFNADSVVVAGGTFYKFANDGNTDITGLTGWQKIESATVFGGEDAPNTVRHVFNYVSPDAESSEAASGTDVQPNVIGVPVEMFEFTGNGSQAAFTVTTALNITDERYLTVRAFLIDGTDRAIALQLEGTAFTVSGYGTDTITLSMTTPVPDGDVLRVRLYEMTSAGNAPLLNFSTYGYDNVNDGSGSMTIMSGAHHTSFNNPNGHNTFDGGSSIYMHSNTRYSYGNGLGHELEAVLSGFASGAGGYLLGNYPVHFGHAGIVGGYSAHFGDQGDVSEFFSTHYGRRGKAKVAGEFVMGCGTVTDPDVGLLQSGRYSLRKQISGTGLTALQNIVAGSSNYVLPENSIATISAIVVILDKANLNNFIKLKVETTVKRPVGTATVIIGDNASVADQVTVLDRGGSAANVSSSSWDAQVFDSTVSGAFSIFVRGGSGLTCMAMADVTVQVVSADLS